MMKNLLGLLIGILIFTMGCLDTNSISKSDDIARLFGLSNNKTIGTKQVLKLSIQGDLKDGSGKPMSYKLMSTGQGINSAGAVRQSAKSRVRFIDYSLEPNVLTGLFVIQNEADEGSIEKYNLYWGNETQKSFLAGFTKTGKKIQFGITKVKKPAHAQKFFLYTAGKNSPEPVELETNPIQDTSAGTITNKDGKFELVLTAGEKTDVSIQDPLTNLASFSVDLTSIDSLDKLQDLEKSIAEKGFSDGFLALYVKIVGSMAVNGQIFVIGPVNVQTNSPAVNTPTSTEPLVDLNTVITTAQADNPEPPSTYTIQANVVGLTGTGLVLQNNGTDNLSVSAGGSIAFPKSYPSGSTYSVTILTQPTNQTCVLTGATGVLTTNAVVVANCASSQNDITAFGFASPSVTGTISGTTISLTVPFGTNVTSLIPTFTTTGSSVNIGGVIQTPGATAVNFTSPQNYTVTAADGSSKVYTVTVTIGPNDAKNITAFGFVSPSVTGIITGTNIAVTVPFATTVTSLVATFSLSGGSATISATPQVSSTTANNFSSPVTYRVTAGDGSTQDYTITVTVSANNPPVASSVAISGTTTLGSTLTGTFSFSDPDGHSAGTHTYQWYRCTDNASTGTCSAIGGATAITYTLAIADDARYIRFSVTPKDQHGLAGILVYSNATTILDGLSPTLSNNILRITQLNSTSATLSWTAATDTVTPQANLQYILYYSLNPAMGTVAEIEANGTPVDDYATNVLSKQVTGLTSEKVYYFNVIVQDNAGFKTAYKVHKDFTYTNMVAYYPMNADTLAKDASGNSLNGSISGGVTLTTDKDGNANSAYSFNGTNGVIVVPDNNNLDLTPANSYTIMAWIKPASINLSGLNGIVSKFHASGTNGYVFRLNNGKLDLDQIMTGGTLSTNTWYHVTATRTGGTIVLYINGVATASSGGILSVVANGDSLHIGEDYHVENTRYFNGTIDDVRIYNRVLSAAEVQNIGGKYTFTGPKTNFDISLLGGWSLCHSENYGGTTTVLTTVLSTCNKPNLMLACRLTGSNTITLAAYAPRADVTFNTLDDTTTVHNANGTNWYYYPTSRSWGFVVGGDTVSKSTCDTNSTNPETRLCWHTGAGVINSGYRCGSTTVSDGTYERLIFHAD